MSTELIKLNFIKSEDGVALQKYSVLLASCRNALKEISYLSRVENPDSLVKIIEKLPFSLRQKWRDVADGITNQQLREITFDDVTSFVEAKARVLNHPIFGNLSNDLRIKSKDNVGTRRRLSFGIEGKHESADGANKNKFKIQKCSMCDGDHILPRCNYFKKESHEGRLKFVRKRGLCDNCLLQGHVVKSCPKPSLCKVTGCQSKHSTYLHPRNDTRVAEKASGPDVPGRSIGQSDNGTNVNNNGAQNGCVNAAKAEFAAIGAGVSVTGGSCQS